MTTKSGMRPVHPGDVLREELDDLGLSANALAKAIDVPANRVTAILNRERGVTADTALRLRPLLRHHCTVLAESAADLADSSSPDRRGLAHSSWLIGRAGMVSTRTG